MRKRQWGLVNTEQSLLEWATAFEEQQCSGDDQLLKHSIHKTEDSRDCFLCRDGARTRGMHTELQSQYKPLVNRHGGEAEGIMRQT